VEPHVDENTIGVAAVLGTTFTGHADDIQGIDAMLAGLRDERGLDVPLHVDAASGGFVWPFLYPQTPWDFRQNDLGKTDATFTLNFSTGSAMVLAQYFNLIRFGRAGYREAMRVMQENTRLLAARLAESGQFEQIGPDEEKLPLVAFRLTGERRFDEFDIAWQVAAERGWMLPACTMPPDADHVRMLRALVKLNLSHALPASAAIVRAAH